MPEHAEARTDKVGGGAGVGGAGGAKRARHWRGVSGRPRQRGHKSCMERTQRGRGSQGGGGTGGRGRVEGLEGECKGCARVGRGRGRVGLGERSAMGAMQVHAAMNGGGEVGAGGGTPAALAGPSHSAPAHNVLGSRRGGPAGWGLNTRHAAGIYICRLSWLSSRTPQSYAYDCTDVGRASPSRWRRGASTTSCGGLSLPMAEMLSGAQRAREGVAEGQNLRGPEAWNEERANIQIWERRGHIWSPSGMLKRTFFPCSRRPAR